MTYYVGLLLKENTIIAADKRISAYYGNVVKVSDSFTKIGKISQYAYFSGAGDMNACGEICRYIREKGLIFPEEIQKVNPLEIIEIYNKHIQIARAQIPDFEKNKDTKGYLNVSFIVGGISRNKEPIIFYLNNLDNFSPRLLKNCPNYTATNMGALANQITNDFFLKIRSDIVSINKNSILIIEYLKHLFGNISKADNSVSPVFDVMTVDINGKDTLKEYTGL